MSKLRWVNQKIIDGELVTLYRNENNEMIEYKDGVDVKGNRVRDKKAKGKNITNDTLKKIWQ